YEKDWSGALIDSSDFKQPEGHSNPTAMIAGTETFTAPDATLGAFTVPEDIIGLMNGDSSIKPTQENFDALSDELKTTGHLTSSGYYFGKDPAAAAIGDQKATFEILKPGTFSILAQQNGSTFQPFQTKAGDPIQRVESGTVDAKLMLAHAQAENNILTWVLRLAGLVVMWIGFALIFKPLSVIADVIPFLGSIVGAGGGLVALLISMVVTFITIAIAWLVVRPLLGGSLLVVAGVVLALAFKAALRRKAVKAS
ncbi:MAG: TMEM43 family protein, partial [Chthoniobacterales bacterium]